MMYWVKIMLLGILTLVLSVNAYGKDCSNNDIEYNTSDLFEEYLYREDSHLVSSDEFYTGRTLNHLLKTRRINASAAFCLSNTTGNDFQNNKFILPVITIQHSFSYMPKFITGRFLYINPHSRVSHSKSYYIYTLEKIII